MENLVVELSKYIIIILITLYTLYCFTAFRNNDKERQKGIFKKQVVLMHLVHIICYLVLYLNSGNIKVVYLYLAEAAFFVAIPLIYRLVYKNMSRLILNNMLMLIMLSLVMLTRLSFDGACKQFAIICGSFIMCLAVPVTMGKFKCMDKFGWVYGGIGLGILLVVFLLAQKKFGARNWLSVFGITVQPSEFVKILFVFFIAALLSVSTNFKQVLKVSILAGAYVLILVASTDLGGALIFFVTYLIMLYVASKQPLYLIAGLLSGSGAALVAYQLFSHVRVRVEAWKNPWTNIDSSGYQVAQSLFAIGTGGWFGMGLSKGLPTSIPVAESDFIISAISEEMGGITAICIILICLSCFIMFINISIKLKKDFYKLIALGFSTLYIFQVFLTVGGATKFIPSTGVTLPLVSYGGSSVLSTIIVFSIIQGLYVLNQNEDDKFERKIQHN